MTNRLPLAATTLLTLRLLHPLRPTQELLRRMISLNGKEVIMHQMLLRSLVRVNQATRTAVLKPTVRSLPPPSEFEEIVKEKKT